MLRSDQAGRRAAALPIPSRPLRSPASGQAGDVRSAAAAYEDAIATHPASIVGAMLERRSDPSGALAHCNRAVDIFPDFRAAHEGGRGCSALLMEAEARSNGASAAPKPNRMEPAAQPGAI
jgi:hypothetical protein